MNIIAPPPLIYLLPVIAALLLQFYFPISVFESGGWLWFISAILFISSCLVVFWAFRVMLSAKTSPNPYIEANNLTIKGPYNYSRNPMYLSMTGLYLSLAFLLNSFWLFLLLIPLLTVIWWGVILREESYLESRFGQQYLDYKKRVRRWL